MNNSIPTEQVARKDHECDWCYLKIPKDHVYQRQAIFGDGTATTWKNHKSCMEIATKLDWFEECYGEGLSGEDFRENTVWEYQRLTNIPVPELKRDEISFKAYLNFIKSHNSINPEP